MLNIGTKANQLYVAITLPILQINTNIKSVNKQIPEIRENRKNCQKIINKLKIEKVALHKEVSTTKKIKTIKAYKRFNPQQ